jgi:hypothetical protein
MVSAKKAPLSRGLIPEGIPEKGGLTLADLASALVAFWPHDYRKTDIFPLDFVRFQFSRSADVGKGRRTPLSVVMGLRKWLRLVRGMRDDRGRAAQDRWRNCRAPGAEQLENSLSLCRGSIGTWLHLAAVDKVDPRVEDHLKPDLPP